MTRLGKMGKCTRWSVALTGVNVFLFFYFWNCYDQKDCYSHDLDVVQAARNGTVEPETAAVILNPELSEFAAELRELAASVKEFEELPDIDMRELEREDFLQDHAILESHVLPHNKVNNRYAAVKNGADIAVPKYTDRLPKFLVIGVMKCGTTALANFLQNHPHVKQSLREPNFFNKDENYHRGFGYYSSLFPQPTYRELLYEKSPEYYNSIMAPARVKAMNSTVKVVNIVCDNVRRTMSRYLHIQQWSPQKLVFLGQELPEFNQKIRLAISDFHVFLSTVRTTEGDGTMDGLVNALLNRLENGQRPFHRKSTDSPLERILSDGFYAIFHTRWQREFSDEQLLVLDGSQFMTAPWVPIMKLQKFLGIREHITAVNFVLDSSGLPCYVNNADNAEELCIGGDKGRSLDKRFDSDVGKALYELFKPFDDYFAQKVLNREPFNWRYGLE